MCCYSALLLTGVVASQPCLGSDTLTRVNGNQAKQCPKASSFSGAGHSTMIQLWGLVNLRIGSAGIPPSYEGAQNGPKNLGTHHKMGPYFRHHRGPFALPEPTAQPRVVHRWRVLWVTGARRAAPGHKSVRPSTTVAWFQEAQGYGRI